MGKNALQRFDNGLVLAQQLVHDQTYFLSAMAHHDDVLPAAVRACEPEVLFQPDQWQDFLAQIDETALRAVALLLCAQFSTFHYPVEGHHVGGVTNSGKKAVDNGQSQGQAYAEGGTAGNARRDQLDHAAQRLYCA